MDSAEQLIKISDALTTDKANFEPIFNDIRTYILPNRDAIYKPTTPGQTTGSRQRFDSIAVESNWLLASSMQGTLTPMTSYWFELALREDDLNEMKEVRDWLETCSKRMHKAYQSSNFGTVFHEGYLDLGGFGTTASFQRELPKNARGEFTGLAFEAFPINEYTVLEGEDGKVAELYREFKLTAKQAFEKFSQMPNFNGLGDKIDKALASDDKKKALERFKFLHVIRPRKERNRNSMRPEDMPIESRYIAVADKHDISVGGFWESPIAVPRWTKLSEDNGWGRGPGWIALPEAMTLSQIKKLGLKGLAKDIAPPLLVPHKGVIGGMKTSPNALNYYNATRNNGQKPEYLTSGNKWDVSQFKEEDLKNQIRSIFFIDQLQLRDSPAMTATEFQGRFEIMQRLLGPTFWRLVHELFNPTIFRTFQIMLRAGAFPPVPAPLQQLAAQGVQPTLDVVYTGPLAKAQRQSEVVAIERTYQLAGGIAQATGDASVFDNLDPDEAIRLGADQLGAPGKLLRDKRVAAQMRDQRAQMQQAQMQSQGMAQDAQTADKLASANQKIANSQ